MKFMLGLILLAFWLTLAKGDPFPVAPTVQYKAGDLITLPTRPGSYMALLWGNPPVWYNEQTEWFQTVPVRNYGSMYLDVTRMIPAGDYQFLEIDAAGNPYDLNNWRWVRDFKVHVSVCDGFSVC